MTQYNKVVAALIALGNSSEEVATKLSELGIKGYCQMAGECPIARYLEKEMGQEYVVVRTCVLGPAGRTVVNNPQGVCAFVMDFDNGKYPDLI